MNIGLACAGLRAAFLCGNVLAQTSTGSGQTDPAKAIAR